jgi:hypothetical protein
LKGGETDAKLIYFNMKEYFKSSPIVYYYALDKSNIHNILKKDILREIYANHIKKIREKASHSKKLKLIWDEINSSLKDVGL